MTVRNFRCIYVAPDGYRWDHCCAPIACSVFGYCRERNFDGKDVNETENKRRKKESDEETIECGD